MRPRCRPIPECPIAESCGVNIDIHTHTHRAGRARQGRAPTHRVVFPPSARGPQGPQPPPPPRPATSALRPSAPPLATHRRPRAYSLSPSERRISSQRPDRRPGAPRRRPAPHPHPAPYTAPPLTWQRSPGNARPGNGRRPPWRPRGAAAAPRRPPSCCNRYRLPVLSRHHRTRPPPPISASPPRLRAAHRKEGRPARPDASWGMQAAPIGKGRGEGAPPPPGAGSDWR